MNHKPGPFPFVYSQIALLMLSLTVVGRPVYAESNEAPAVLQFARKYQQEQIDIPQYKPSGKVSRPQRKNVPLAHKNPVKVPVENESLLAKQERRQLLQLQNSITQKEREITTQSLTIQKLEKQLSVLQQTAHKAATAATAAPAASPHDVQMVQKMVESLYRTLTLRPASDTLAENLKQANQQAAKARLAEAAMQEQQKELKSQLTRLQDQLAALKNNRVQMTTEHEASLTDKLEKLNTQNQRLESDLVASREKVSQASEQVRQLELSMRKLESEKKQYADDNKRLMLQISDHSSAIQTLESVKKQQNKLQDELATRQQQLTQLEKEKQQLQQQLAAAPTPAQLADSQQKLKALQEKLDVSQAKQVAMQSEMQQLQQKLQTNLLSKEENSAAIAAQLKALQDKLASAQLQQTAMQAQKEKLQQQLDHAPTPAQLVESQQKVKSLQDELAANTLLLQKKEMSASEQIKASNADLMAEKKSAEQKLKALQTKLDAMQAQQTALLTEKQQLQQKLQTNLLSKEENSAAIAAQLKALQDKLSTTQLQQTALQAQKEKLQQQLDQAPTPAQLAESQQKVKSLQDELAANTLLLQKKEMSASEQIKASNADLMAEKKSAEQKLKALQTKLDAMQAQQTALLTEKQQLQNDLKGNAQTSAALNAQTKELQDKLAMAQQQHKALVAENEKLQHQLNNLPTAAQLAESQKKTQALQAQLDSAILLQKNKSSVSEQDKTRNAALMAEKNAAEDKVKTLQKELSVAQAQQTALQTEKQQLQQKLQSNATVVAQLKELQDKLVAAQQQQNITQSEKEKLQHQLDNMPSEGQLADSQLKIKALQGQLDAALLLQKKTTVASVDAAKNGESTITAQYKAAEDKIKQLQAELDAAQVQLTQATKQNVSQKVKTLPEITSETLKKKSTREAYAIGLSLGSEILQLQAENRNWASTDTDKPSVLAGIIDSFQGKEKLSPIELQKSLMNISERVASGREKFMSDLDKSTKKFIAAFTKQKNVKKSTSGFWYRVGYEGDTPIPAGAVIDVVVKESLTNGKVIEDMDAKGIVLTQPISAFPPVFREALSKLKNHGSITIVVPPALAYGDKGYPPKIPPNATMVYDLRISEVYPEQAKK
ncbi:FKBP-type peptidyl-prolyl cis-trans isomerase N-terminal domain-containing protein [Erwiniaceae bacterium CAU 1747]